MSFKRLKDCPLGFTVQFLKDSMLICEIGPLPPVPLIYHSALSKQTNKQMVLLNKIPLLCTF